MSTGVYVCPCWKQHLEIDKEYLGVKIECPTCKHQFVVANSLLGRDKEEEKKSFWFDDPNSLKKLSQQVEEKSQVKQDKKSQTIQDDFTCNFAAAFVTTILFPVFGLIPMYHAIKSWEYKKLNNLAKAKECSIASENATTIIWCIYILCAFISVLLGMALSR